MLDRRYLKPLSAFLLFAFALRLRLHHLSYESLFMDELRQVSDYLEKDTIGQFGMIFSRNGLSDNGKVKQREILSNRTKKMILVLDEKDIIDLIQKKANDESAEDLLEDFKFELELSL